MGNLVFNERFDGTLGSWTLDQAGGSVSIVTQDNSTKMRLVDSSGAALVSAKRAFAEPAGAYLIEADMNVLAGGVGIIELLDAADSVIAACDLGSTPNVLSFSTDTAAASTRAWTQGTYKQIVLLVDKAAGAITCWLSEDDAIYGSLFKVAAKLYSGTAVAAIRFRSTAAVTATIYADEVRVYTPWEFFIGDSITDGKLYWSTHPAYPDGRLAAQEDQTSPPHYVYQNLYGADYWAANRAFGGSTLDDVDSKIQSAVLDQKPVAVNIGCGHNDIMAGATLAQLQSRIVSVIAKCVAAGVTGSNLRIGNVMPSSYINTDLERSIRAAYNTWLRYKCAEVGAIYVDLDAALRNPSNYEELNPAYRYTDSTHLVPAGSAVWAQTFYNAVAATARAAAYAGDNIMRPDPGANDERMYLAGELDLSLLPSMRGIERRIFAGGLA